MNSGISTLASGDVGQEGMIRFRKLEPDDEMTLRAQLQGKYGK